jgi:hypothetical protein
MESSIGIVIGIVIVGFVVYNFFIKSDKSASAPAPVKEAPAKAPVKEVKEEKVEVVKAPTKAQLSSKTKKEIDDLAKNEWGIKLDARETKDKMVAQFVKEAKAIAKK